MTAKPVLVNDPFSMRMCRGCGCTDDFACLGGCSWVLLDIGLPTGVCSVCASECGWSPHLLATIDRLDERLPRVDFLAMTAKPVRTRELAERLGISVETFYLRRFRLHADDGLPASLSRHRPYRWDRASIDAWFARHHPLAPKATAPAPANDPVALPPAADDTAWRERLALAYRRT